MSERLQRNNFDLLRVLFASTVFLVHSYELSGYPALACITDYLSSAVAVKAFFVVSGFLIFMSYEKSPSLHAYFIKRLRRIYPAYAFVILSCAFCLFFISSVEAAAYFNGVWLKYLFSNLTFVNFFQPVLPGVFEMNRLPTVNGALWTLKIEVMFYLSVPVLVLLFRRYGHLNVMLATYFCSFAYAQILGGVAEARNSPMLNELARQLPGQLTYFMAGASLYYYRSYFERHCLAAVILAILGLGLNKVLPLSLLEPISLGTLVIFLGLYCYAGNFGKHGDFSYGIYILHFPVAQTLLWTQAFNDKPWLFLGFSGLLTFVGAYLLWNGVEKHFLLKRNHYVLAPSESGQYIKKTD